jgi:hypothetical protein
MVKSISFIFWGLFLVILDLNINQFDLLPDFIGYILVAVGSRGLINSSNQFATSRICCWLLAALSIIDIIVKGQLLIVLGLFGLVINCIMMWFLLGGFSDIALKFNRSDLSGKALTRRIVYIALSCATMLIWLLALAFRAIAPLATVTIVIAMIVLVIMILHLIYQIKTIVVTSTDNLFGNIN